jgi:hypothetical protein
MTETPIACTLSGPDLAARLSQMAALGDEALEAVELRFRPGPQIRERLDAIARAEAECCPFLTLDVREEPDGLVLRIAGPRETAPVVAELVAAFAGA